MSTQHKVPTLAELHKGNPDAFANDQIKTLLNTEPPKAWIKKHPMTNGPYMPVDKVDYLLDYIFSRWEVVVKSIFQIENSVCAIITLKVWNPHRNDWDYQDGGGAMPLQVDKDFKPSDMKSIKSNAVQLAVPAAISYAKKDAADNFGKIFGRDLTRKDTVAWDPSFKEDPYVFEPLADGDKAPPPPPSLPPELAAKVVITENTLLQVAAQPASQAAQVPVIDVTPPTFNANAFANPATTNTAPVQPTAVQFPDLNTSINF